MRWLHLLVGLVGIVGFLGTGQYMDKGYDHLRGMDDVQRLLFRSTHIYILYGSIINLAMGLNLRSNQGWRRWVRSVGSVLLISTPLLAAVGFFTEPWQSGLERPYSRLAAYSCLAGMLLHLVCWSLEQHETSAEQSDPPKSPVGREFES